MHTIQSPGQNKEVVENTPKRPGIPFSYAIFLSRYSGFWSDIPQKHCNGFSKDVTYMWRYCIWKYENLQLCYIFLFKQYNFLFLLTE